MVSRPPISLSVFIPATMAAATSSVSLVSRHASIQPVAQTTSIAVSRPVLNSSISIIHIQNLLFRPKVRAATPSARISTLLRTVGIVPLRATPADVVKIAPSPTQPCQISIHSLDISIDNIRPVGYNNIVFLS